MAVRSEALSRRSHHPIRRVRLNPYAPAIGLHRAGRGPRSAQLDMDTRAVRGPASPCMAQLQEQPAATHFTVRLARAIGQHELLVELDYGTGWSCGSRQEVHDSADVAGLALRQPLRVHVVAALHN